MKVKRSRKRTQQQLEYSRSSQVYYKMYFNIQHYNSSLSNQIKWKQSVDSHHWEYWDHMVLIPSGSHHDDLSHSRPGSLFLTQVSEQLLFHAAPPPYLLAAGRVLKQHPGFINTLLCPLWNKWWHMSDSNETKFPLAVPHQCSHQLIGMLHQWSGCFHFLAALFILLWVTECKFFRCVLHVEFYKFYRWK